MEDDREVIQNSQKGYMKWLKFKNKYYKEKNLMYVWWFLEII